MTSNNYDAFIVYNSRDRAQVETIVDWLEKRGLRLSYDRRAGIPGNLWVHKLYKALDMDRARRQSPLGARASGASASPSEGQSPNP
jgi:TIR domain